MDFWQIYQIVLRRKWIVIAITLLATVSTAVGYNLMAKYYRATAVLMPSDQALRRSDPVTGVGETDPASRQMRFASLMALAKSQTVVERALRSLQWNLPPSAVSSDITVEPVVAAEGRQPTEMIQIQAFSREPRRAVDLTNAMAQAFVSYYHEVTHQEASRNRVFLERQAEAARLKLSSTENSLVLFKKRRSMAAPGEEITAAIGGITPLRNTRDEAQAQLAESDARLSAYRAQLAKLSPVRVMHEDDGESPVIRGLEDQLAKLESEQVMELAVHTPKHSRVRLLDAQIGSLKERLNQELRKHKPRERVVTNPVYETVRGEIVQLQGEHEALAARVSQLNGLLAGRQAQLTGLSGATEEFDGLTREYQLAEENYRNIVIRLNQARLGEKISNDSGGLAVVDLAALAEGPIRRGLGELQMILAAFVLSLLVGIGLVVAMEALDNTIRTGKDAEDLVGLPVAGLIPRLNSGADTSILPRITHVQPVSAHAEAYRFLGTDFLFSAAEDPLKTLMVATAKPGQGGTTTLSNLAITLAQAGRRVVLVDADMRRPMLHGIFGVSNDKGLSSVLQGQATADKVICPTEIENLLLIPGGPVPENPWKLLRSRQMRDLVSTLREKSDFVLFDTPSAVVFADAAVLASMVDGVFLVIRAQQSPRGSELQVRQLLNKAKANIIGVVLNDVQPESVDSYHYHSRYYPIPGSTLKEVESKEMLQIAKPGSD